MRRDAAATNDPSPDRTTRSRSRGRANLVGSTSTQVARHSNRSSSRAGFLGRSRQRTYQIYENPNAQQRWRSESRTVRGSLEDEDGHVFTSDDDPEDDRQGKGEAKSRKLASTVEETTLTGRSAMVAAALPAAQQIPLCSHQQNAAEGNKEVDVEAQAKHPPPQRVSRLSRIPYPIAHFLGHRSKNTENRALLPPLEKLPRKIETLLWAWIGAALGLGFVMITFSRWHRFAMSSSDPVTAWGGKSR